MLFKDKMFIGVADDKHYPLEVGSKEVVFTNPLYQNILNPSRILTVKGISYIKCDINDVYLFKIPPVGSTFEFEEV